MTFIPTVGLLHGRRGAPQLIGQLLGKRMVCHCTQQLLRMRSAAAQTGRLWLLAAAAVAHPLPLALPHRHRSSGPTVIVLHWPFEAARLWGAAREVVRE